MRSLFVLLITVALFLGCAENNSDKSFLKGEYRAQIGYNIWVKSFADSDGDNIGDLNGITGKLDYLKNLGITTIKLSPILKAGFTSDSPCANTHGYDIIDYYELNPQFGTKEDLKNLLSEAHSKKIKVVFDYVPNHSSNLHPWFIDSKNGGDKKDWYTWSDKPEENWGFAWGGGSWENVWFKAGERYYYSAFTVPSLPDFNYKNPEVQTEMLNIAKYWLDFGFDGLRVDAARYIWEDGPGKAADRYGTMEFFRKLRKLTDSYDEKFLIAEAWSGMDDIGRYYGNGSDLFHMCVDFPFAWFVTQAAGLGKADEFARMMRYYRDNYPKGAEPASFTNNHDDASARNFSNYNDPQKATFALALTAFTSGVPFYYYGDEFGTKGEKHHGLHQVYSLRGPLDWQAAEDQLNKENSMINWVSRFNKIRQMFPVISYGDVNIIEHSDNTILPVVYYNNKEEIVIIYNCSDEVKDVTVSEDLSDNASVILGDPANVSINDGRITVKQLPAKSLAIVYDGKTKHSVIAGSPVNVTGGADYKKIECNEYPEMYALVNGKKYKMHNLPVGGWEAEIKLPKGKHEWQFTNGDKVWGNNNVDDIADENGNPVKFEMNESGTYVLQFSRWGKHYLAYKK